MSRRAYTGRHRAKRATTAPRTDAPAILSHRPVFVAASPYVAHRLSIAEALRLFRAGLVLDAT